MNKTLLLFLLLITSELTFGQQQRYTLQGAIADTSAKPLTNATVLLMLAKDSSLVNFGRSNDKGQFMLKNLSPEKYLLKITFVGYQPYTQVIPPVLDTELDLGLLHMKPLNKQLAEVLIKGEKAPVTIKQDTIEYNADSFKTRPNAVVEDLLKKLPGVEVSRDGTVKAQGEQVRRVTVDGKEFFGNDPKIATKNLPAEAVDKVQVFDRKSDQSVFSGIDDGQREKSINLTLKEDKKNGYFGTAMAGYGTNNRYTGKLNLNRFSKTNRFSLIGNTNNINQQGFTLNDAIGLSGGMGAMMSGGGMRIEVENGMMNGIPINTGGRNNGFVSSGAVGANFNSQASKKTEINGNYFYNSLNSQIDQTVERENFLPNKRFLSTQQANQQTQNDNHRLNLTIDHKIDSLNSIKWTNNFTLNRSKINTGGFNETRTDNNSLQNDGTRQNTSDGNNTGLVSNMLWRHKFLKKSRTFSANLNFTLNNSNTDGRLQALNRYYQPNGNVLHADTLQQINTQMSERSSYSANLSYTEPLGKRKFIEARYNFSKSLSDVNQEVYDLRRGERIFNQNLSNRFNNDFTYHRAGLTLRYNGKNSNIAVGFNWQQSVLEGELVLRNLSVKRTFSNLLPNAMYRYNFTNSNHLNFDYQTNIREPSITQLAPVINNTDPLNIYVGNPDLRPEFSHRLSLQYLAFNQLSFTNFFAFINLAYTTNKITNSQQISNLFVRTSKPVNVPNDYMLNGNVSYGFRIKPIKTRVNIGSNLSYARSLNPINEVVSTTKRMVVSPNVRLEYALKEKLNVSLEHRRDLNRTRYSVGASQNQSFVNQSYTLDLDLNLSKSVLLTSNFDYDVFDFGSGEVQRVPIWAAALSKYILKNNKGELKFSVFDLLNRNVGINRRADVNFVETQRVRSLGRYFMLTFTYSLRGIVREGQGGGNRVIFGR